MNNKRTIEFNEDMAKSLMNESIINTENYTTGDIISQSIEGASNGINEEGITIHAKAKGRKIHNRLIEVSRERPGETIRARHTLSINEHNKIYTVQYINGIDEVIKEGYNYIFEGFKAPKGYTTEQIISKIIGEWERVDKLSKAANIDLRAKKIKGGINPGVDTEPTLLDFVIIELEDYLIQATVESGLVKVKVWENRLQLLEV